MSWSYKKFVWILGTTNKTESSSTHTGEDSKGKIASAQALNDAKVSEEGTDRKKTSETKKSSDSDKEKGDQGNVEGLEKEQVEITDSQANDGKSRVGFIAWFATLFFMWEI